MKRQTIIVLPLLLVFVLIGIPLQTNAQQADQKSVKEIQPISDKTRIWTGTASLRWYNFYTRTSGGLEEQSNTELDLNFSHLWLSDQHFGWGLQGMTQILMTDFFGNVGLGNIGIGPVLRWYLLESNQWQPYMQGGMLIGYDLALSDALGANRSEGMRYRPGLRAGITYRVSNKFGVYMEIGPDWEADEAFEFDSRALQFDIGIQLFRF